MFNYHNKHTLDIAMQFPALSKTEPPISDMQGFFPVRQEVKVFINLRKPLPLHIDKTHSFTLTSCFVTFSSRLAVAVVPPRRVIHVGHGTCDIFIQPPESSVGGLTLPELRDLLAAGLDVSGRLHVSCPCGKPLQDLSVALGAEPLPVCAQVLGSLLGDVPEVFNRRITAARPDLVLCAKEGRDSGNLCQGVACGRRSESSWEAAGP